MFNKPTPIANPWELSHHFYAHSEFISGDDHVITGGRCAYAETEAELYLCIEQDGWEENPDHPGIIYCAEYVDNKVIRTWELYTPAYVDRIRIANHAFPVNHPILATLANLLGCTVDACNDNPGSTVALCKLLYPNLYKEEVR